MPLWGNIDYGTGNNKPLWANTSNAYSNSTINSTTANSVYGFVYGVSAGEAARAGNPPIAHPGWVAHKIGTGPVVSVGITRGGEGINAAGFLILTDQAVNGAGTGANISYSIANSLNSLQGFSTNTRQNTISTITINNGGSLYSNGGAVNVTISGSFIVGPEFTITLGGRAGRNFYETLVAMGSITGDDPKDNSYFSGV